MSSSWEDALAVAERTPTGENLARLRETLLACARDGSASDSEKNTEAAWHLATLSGTAAFRTHLVDIIDVLLGRWSTHEDILCALAESFLQAYGQAIDSPGFSAEAPQRTLAQRLTAALVPDPSSVRTSPRRAQLRANLLTVLQQTVDAEAAYTRCLQQLHPSPDAAVVYDYAVFLVRVRRFADARIQLLRLRELTWTDAAQGKRMQRAAGLTTAAVALACGDQSAFEHELARLSIDLKRWPERRDAVLVRVPCRGIDAGADFQHVGFEVVQVFPLSPVHGSVLTPTFARSVVAPGDVILTLPTPVDSVVVADETMPVFPFLGILASGGAQVFSALVRADEQTWRGFVSELHEGCPGLGVHTSVACGDGRVGRYVVVLRDAELTATRRVAALWERLKRPGLTTAIPALFERAEMSKTAGQHHQAWGVLERLARG